MVEHGEYLLSGLFELEFLSEKPQGLLEHRAVVVALQDVQEEAFGFLAGHVAHGRDDGSLQVAVFVPEGVAQNLLDAGVADAAQGLDRRLGHGRIVAVQAVLEGPGQADAGQGGDGALQPFGLLVRLHGRGQGENLAGGGLSAHESQALDGCVLDFFVFVVQGHEHVLAEALALLRGEQGQRLAAQDVDDGLDDLVAHGC